jgi:ubiquinone/menaquinone biosynthesis C-methylase UbiE
MNRDTYHKDHWVDIEAERLERYEQQFIWRPERDPLLEPARLEVGHTVLDFGCGPGYVALELARRVGEHGRVHGVDLNRAFVERARRRAADAGLADRVHIHHVTDETLPLDDHTFDRAICKNVLEYVPEVHRVLIEIRRVLRPGGLLHVIDSDWDFLIVEPWSPETITAFFRAAAPAFREPNIGRKLPGAMRRAGYRDVDTRIFPRVDTQGLSLFMLRNMASYIRHFGTMDPNQVDGLLRDVEHAVEVGENLMVLPQFLVTAVA